MAGDMPTFRADHMPYGGIKDSGFGREGLRYAIEAMTETKILVTSNARALRHFLTVRGAIPGDVEMRQVAAALLKLLHPEAPSVFEDFHIRLLPDGSPIVMKGGNASTLDAPNGLASGPKKDSREKTTIKRVRRRPNP